MKIHILAVGKIGKNYLKEGIADYSKRISKHCKFSIAEVAEQNGDKPRDKEGKILLEKLGNLSAYFTVALTPASQSTQLLSSELFAELLATKQNQGHSNFCFVVGGSEGLSGAVLAETDFLQSFSPLTFPHQLFRLILCEQIYRCLKINSGQVYHK